MKQWKKWESETASLEYQFANGQDQAKLAPTHSLTESRCTIIAVHALMRSTD
jgi:hypothetical protein